MKDASEAEDGNEEFAHQARLLSILSPLSRSSPFSRSSVPSSTFYSTPTVSLKREDDQNPDEMSFGSPGLSPISSPCTMISTLPVSPDMAQNVETENGLGIENNIKNILWDVPVEEEAEIEILTPDMELIGPPSPFFRSEFNQQAGVGDNGRSYSNVISKPHTASELPIRYASGKSEQRITFGPIPARRNRLRTITHTAENFPPKERNIPALIGPNALPYGEPA